MKSRKGGYYFGWLINNGNYTSINKQQNELKVLKKRKTNMKVLDIIKVALVTVCAVTTVYIVVTLWLHM